MEAIRKKVSSKIKSHEKNEKIERFKKLKKLTLPHKIIHACFVSGIYVGKTDDSGTIFQITWTDTSLKLFLTQIDTEIAEGISELLGYGPYCRFSIVTNILKDGGVQPAKCFVYQWIDIKEDGLLKTLLKKLQYKKELVIFQ